MSGLLSICSFFVLLVPWLLHRQLNLLFLQALVLLPPLLPLQPQEGQGSIGCSQHLEVPLMDFLSEAVAANSISS